MDWWIGDYWTDHDISTVVPVQAMPPGPPNAVNRDVVSALAATCPDEQVAAILVEGVHPRNRHQDATVVSTNHESSLLHADLVGKAHREQLSLGNIQVRRPEQGAFRVW